MALHPDFTRINLKLVTVPAFFEETDQIEMWRGRSLEWFLLEIMVFIFFVATMMFLIIKSRFIKVGIDHSH